MAFLAMVQRAEDKVPMHTSPRSGQRFYTVSSIELAVLDRSQGVAGRKRLQQGLRKMPYLRRADDHMVRPRAWRGTLHRDCWAAWCAASLELERGQMSRCES